MATVISGGFPGRVAQEVQPNGKCNGCLHFDGQAGRIGACLIGLRPWLCGDGGAADIGYAPIARGAGSYLPDLNDHGAHAPEVPDAQDFGMYGSGSTRSVPMIQVSLGEEHVHLVKSMVTEHSRLQKSACRSCSNSGGGVGFANVGFQLCTCSPIEATAVAKAIASRFSNAERQLIPMDDVVEFVRDVAKAGFKAPLLKAGFYTTGGKYQSQTTNSGQHTMHFHPNDGGESVHVGTFSSHREARHAGLQHDRKRLASGTGADNAAPKREGGLKKLTFSGAHSGTTGAHPVTVGEAKKSDLEEPTTKKKIKPTALAKDELEDANPGRGTWAGHVGAAVAADAAHPSPLLKAIDNAKHSHIVTGKLAPQGRGYSNVHQARAAVDKLDNKYGASAHSYAKNPNHKPAATPTGDWKQKYPGGKVAQSFGKSVAWITSQLQAGKRVHHESGTKAHVSENHERKTKSYTVISPNGMKTFHDTPEEAAHTAFKHTQSVKKSEEGTEK